MANSLNEELTGKVVVLRESRFKEEYKALQFRVFEVSGGFGADSYTAGTALFGTFLVDGEQARMNGYDVERLATEEDLALVESVRGG